MHEAVAAAAEDDESGSDYDYHDPLQVLYKRYKYESKPLLIRTGLIFNSLEEQF